MTIEVYDLPKFDTEGGQFLTTEYYALKSFLDCREKGFVGICVGWIDMRRNKNSKINIMVEDFREPIVPDDVHQHIKNNFDFYQRLSVSIQSIKTAQELQFLHHAIRRLPDHEKEMFWGYLKDEITQIRGGQLKKTTPLEDELNRKNRIENIKHLSVIFFVLAMIVAVGVMITDCSNASSKRKEYHKCIDVQNMVSQDLQDTQYNVDSSKTSNASIKTYKANDGSVTVTCNKFSGEMEISTSKN